jgi:hypothetical protein
MGHFQAVELKKYYKTERIPAGRRKPYDFYNTFIIPRHEDDLFRGSKHVAWLKYTNINCIFNIVVFNGYSLSFVGEILI